MRVNIILGILVLALGILTCKNFQKTNPSETAQTTNQGANPKVDDGVNAFGAAHIIHEERPDTVQGAYQVRQAPRRVEVPVDVLPEPTASKKAYLSTGWWHLNMAYQGSDTTIHHNYQQKWLRFQEDQSFEVFVKGKVVDKGRWNFDSAKNEILLSCNDTYINNSWGVQEKGFVMIWKGNTSLNVTGIQVRVVGQRTEPNW